MDFWDDDEFRPDSDGLLVFLFNNWVSFSYGNYLRSKFFYKIKILLVCCHRRKLYHFINKNERLEHFAALALGMDRTGISLCALYVFIRFKRNN